MKICPTYKGDLRLRFCDRKLFNTRMFGEWTERVGSLLHSTAISRENCYFKYQDGRGNLFRVLCVCVQQRSSMNWCIIQPISRLLRVWAREMQRLFCNVEISSTLPELWVFPQRCFQTCIANTKKDLFHKGKRYIDQTILMDYFFEWKNSLQPL